MRRWTQWHVVRYSFIVPGTSAYHSPLILCLCSSPSHKHDLPIHQTRCLIGKTSASWGVEPILSRENDTQMSGGPFASAKVSTAHWPFRPTIPHAHEGSTTALNLRKGWIHYKFAGEHSTDSERTKTYTACMHVSHNFCAICRFPKSKRLTINTSVLNARPVDLDIIVRSNPAHRAGSWYVGQRHHGTTRVSSNLT